MLKKEVIHRTIKKAKNMLPINLQKFLSKVLFDEMIGAQDRLNWVEEKKKEGAEKAYVNHSKEISL